MFLGQYGQPPVHYFADGVTIRDTGLVWSSLTWNMSDEKYFLPAAVIYYMDGPLQYVILNWYQYLIGDWVPLGPATEQFPNTVFIYLGCFFAYLIGREIHSEKFGYLLSVTAMACL